MKKDPDKTTLQLFESLTTSLQHADGLLDEDTRKSLSNAAIKILADIPDEKVVQVTHRTGTRARVVSNGINALDLPLLRALSKRVKEPVTYDRPHVFLPARFSPETMEEAWQLWTTLIKTDTQQNYLLEFFADAVERKRMDTAEMLCSWYQKQPWPLRHSQWHAYLNKARMFNKQARSMLLSMMKKSFENPENTHAIFDEAIRGNHLLPAVVTLSLNPATRPQYMDDFIKREGFGFKRHQALQWLFDTLSTGHGQFAFQALLDSGNLAPEILMAAEAGNPEKLICDAIGIETHKVQLILNKEQRQRERGRTPGKRRVKARRKKGAASS